MNLESINEILARSNRIMKRLGLKEGHGAAWSVKLDNGEIHKYVLGGVKPPEEFKDDIENNFVWLWSLKDRVKSFTKSKGISKEWIEKEINADQKLCICADIANRSKHGELDKKSRSGKYPKLGNVKYEIPQQAISSITVRGYEVVTDISDFKSITLEMPVLSENNECLGDAFEYLDYAIKWWENLIEKKLNNKNHEAQLVHFKLN